MPSENTRPDCGKCGLPIEEHEVGIRHFGFFTAHSEQRCRELLKAQITEEQENVRIAKNNALAILNMKQSSDDFAQKEIGLLEKRISELEARLIECVSTLKHYDKRHGDRCDNALLCISRAQAVLDAKASVTSTTPTTLESGHPEIVPLGSQEEGQQTKDSDLLQDSLRLQVLIDKSWQVIFIPDHTQGLYHVWQSGDPTYQICRVASGNTSREAIDNARATLNEGPK